jgi:hypothetical protein
VLQGNGWAWEEIPDRFRHLKTLRDPDAGSAYDGAAQGDGPTAPTHRRDPMRIALALLTASLLVFSVHALASGDEPEAAGADDIADLKARIEALEIEGSYLRSREQALTRYILLNEQRADGLSALIAKVRREGFENKSIPAPSRVSLMAGLDGLAGSLRASLPVVSRDEVALLKKATAHRKLHRLDTK